MDQTASVDIPNPTFLPQKHTGHPLHRPSVTLDLPLLGMGASTITDQVRVALEEASWSDRTILDLYPDVTWTKYCASSVDKKDIMRIHAETKMYQGTVEGKKEAISGAKEKSNSGASFLFLYRFKIGFAESASFATRVGLVRFGSLTPVT